MKAFEPVDIPLTSQQSVTAAQSACNAKQRVRRSGFSYPNSVALAYFMSFCFKIQALSAAEFLKQLHFYWKQAEQVSTVFLSNVVKIC